MVVFKKDIIGIRSFKNRYSNKSKIFKFKFGQYALVASNEACIELVQLGDLKKWVKKIVKRKKDVKRKGKYKRRGKKINLKHIRIEGLVGKSWHHKRRKKMVKIWLFLWPNHVLFRKSKNSRMGKGKGSFSRWSIKIRQGHTVLESYGLPKFILKRLKKKFNKRSRLQLCVCSNVKMELKLKIWSSGDFSYEYFHRYRAM